MRLVPLMALLIFLTAVVHAHEVAIFAPNAKLKVESAGGSGGEGPAWDPKLGVFTSGNGHIYRLDRDGKSHIFRKGTGTNGLLFDATGRLLACEPELRRVTATTPDGTILVLTDRYKSKRYNHPNDITVDSKGRIYFSDPRYGNRQGMEISTRTARRLRVSTASIRTARSRASSAASWTAPTASWCRPAIVTCTSPTTTTIRSAAPASYGVSTCARTAPWTLRAERCCTTGARAAVRTGSSTIRKAGSMWPPG
jgi:hypothetical protein